MYANLQIYRALHAKKDRNPCGFLSFSLIYLKQLKLSGVLFPSFFNTSFFTCKVTEVEDACSAHHAVFVDIDLFDERGGEGENSFHTYTAGNLTNSKGLGASCTGELQNNSLELLDTFFVSFTDFIVDSDGIAGLELGERLAFYLVFNKLQ